MTPKKRIVLVGSGGTAADVLSIIDAINRSADQSAYEVVGLLDDRLVEGSEKFGFPILGGLGDHRDIDDVSFVDCLGSPNSYQSRMTLQEKVGLLERNYETIVHPSAFLASDVVLGTGCIIYPNVVLLGGVVVETHVTVLANSVLNHGVHVGQFSILASGVNLSGAVQVGQNVYLGCGCNVKENINIGDGALIGLGGAVLRDVEQGSIVVGVPAQPLGEAK